MQTGVETFEDGNPSSFCLPCLCLAPGLKAAAASCKVVVELWYLLRRAAQSVSQSVSPPDSHFDFWPLSAAAAAAPQSHRSLAHSLTCNSRSFLPSFRSVPSLLPSLLPVPIIAYFFPCPVSRVSRPCRSRSSSQRSEESNSKRRELCVNGRTFIIKSYVMRLPSPYSRVRVLIQ